MRFVAYEQPLPTNWGTMLAKRGLVAEADISLHRKGRLLAKLLIFENPTELQRFWKKRLGGGLGRSCLGAVNALAQERTKFQRNGVELPTVLRGDRRYFCVIGLSAKHLIPEIIAHEAVHAGFAYERRVRRNMFGPACDFDEERIAYPAGRIAGSIEQFARSKGLMCLLTHSK
jgi:hypothetical protein